MSDKIMSKFFHHVSLRIRHIFHVLSNVRPIVWICLYISAMPIFAAIYTMLPEGQFRIPDGGTTDYWSWLYYSIVTLTTLGFGDYTPCLPLSQYITAVEVMCGVIIIGFFLNAVGSMKSEIDVESEIEKQKRLKEAAEKQKLDAAAPNVLRLLHAFVNHCAAVLKPNVTDKNVADLMRSAAHTALALDAMQMRIDMSFWPKLMEDCFTFVANYQLIITEVGTKVVNISENSEISAELKKFVTESSKIAQDIEAEFTRTALPDEE